eukprot:gene22685-29837_t
MGRCSFFGCSRWAQKGCFGRCCTHKNTQDGEFITSTSGRGAEDYYLLEGGNELHGAYAMGAGEGEAKKIGSKRPPTSSQVIRQTRPRRPGDLPERALLADLEPTVDRVFRAMPNGVGRLPFGGEAL